MPNVRVIPPEPDWNEWRRTKADGLEATALLIDQVLDLHHELDAIFESEHDETALRMLRSWSALLRSRRNDRLDVVAELRAALKNGAGERVSA